MAGGVPQSNPQGSRYTHNDSAFLEYENRLRSINLPTFVTATTRFTEWLGSDKAYYPNARAPVRLPPSSRVCVLLIVESAFRSSLSSRYVDDATVPPSTLTTRNQVRTRQYLPRSRGSIHLLSTGQEFTRPRPLDSTIPVASQASREPPESLRAGAQR